MQWNISKTNRFLLLAILAGLLLFGASAFSQTTPVFSLALSPELPLAGDRLTITVVPQNFSATSTTYLWSRDGQTLTSASGLGRSVLTITTDPVENETIQITVRVNPGPEFIPAEETAVIATLPNPAVQQQALEELKSEFTLEASELNPNPNEEVTVRVKTFAFDKTAASYQWSINGVFQRELSGRSRSEITVPAGAEGTVKTVRVAVTTLDGITRTKELTIKTASASLYWWADTTVPYWYRGKALPSANSRVTVVATPPAGMNPNELSYQWQFNGSVIPQASGFGKNTFTFTFEFPVRELVEVTMRNLAGTFVKAAAIDVEPRAPTVAIYESRPLRGVVHERVLREFSAPSGDSYELLAVPFFFPEERVKSLHYDWIVNGERIVGTFTKPWLLTLRPNPGEITSNQVTVEINDGSRGGERTSTSVRADFR